MAKLMMFGVAFVAFLIGGGVLLAPKEVSEDLDKATEHRSITMFSVGGIKWAGWVAIACGVVFLIAAFVA